MKVITRHLTKEILQATGFVLLALVGRPIGIYHFARGRTQSGEACLHPDGAGRYFDGLYLRFRRIHRAAFRCLFEGI